MKIRLSPVLILTGTLGIAWLGWLPLASKPVNGLFLLAMLCVWCGVWMAVRKNPAGRIVWGMVSVAAAVPFLLPGKEMNRERLRDDYVAEMAAFEGVTYRWGGENKRGIDCSGLPRRAFRDALLKEGFRNFNGAAFRAFAEQWWFDASALALRDRYRGYAKPLGISGTIRTIDASRLQPGDLAITRSGNHVIVYAGGGKWIQADPGKEKVMTEDPAQSDNRWFDTKVALFRWREL